MCGIIGFTGKLDATEVLLNGLSELEYRGYDSAGIAFFEENTINTIKAVGKVSNLKDKVMASSHKDITCGIGHTRWATHGGVSEVNCHPHTYGKVTIIHNGIIENYQTIEDDFVKKGEKPVSQTDTEIAAMLINNLYSGDAYDALRKASKILDGAYAFCIMFKDQPGTIYSIRNGSPLVACHTNEGSIVASDMVALIKYSKDYFVLPEHHIAKLTEDDIVVTTLDGTVVEPKMLHVDWDITSAKKGGYDHFMLKEIHEQPDALHNTITPRIVNGKLDFAVDNIDDELFNDVNRIIIVGCGTAMHAGLVGKVMFERLLRVPVTVEIASEYRYNNPIIDAQTLVITISQSGETADTLAALRLSKEAGSKTLSIVNVKGSSIARESDYVFYTHAGPEIAVASTKAYTVQLASIYMLAFKFAMVKKSIDQETCASYIDQLQDVISSVKTTIGYDKRIEEISKDLSNAEDLFFIGRGLDSALSCEGSIKFKEITYIHSEAYAAGELKHGTLSLITQDIPVIALATQENVYQKMISNIREVRARGAKVILITNGEMPVDEDLCAHHIILPKTDDQFAPFTTAVVLQLIAYYTSVHRGLDVDQPRNLAKSVTVE